MERSSMTKFQPLPVGYRFRPSDYEISAYFLSRKAYDLPFKCRFVPEDCHDIFFRHPRDMPGDTSEKHRYFFCRKHKNQVSNLSDHWIQIGEDINVIDPMNNDQLVGIKRPFALIWHQESDNFGFSFDESPKYSWFLDEYSLPTTANSIETEFKWVLCHVFRKKIKAKTITPLFYDFNGEINEESEGESFVALSANKEQEQEQEEEEEEEEEEEGVVLSGDESDEEQCVAKV